MSSQNTAMLDGTGVFGVFAAFNLLPTRMDHQLDAETVHKEAMAIVDDHADAVLVDTYITRGLTPVADYFLRVHAHELATAQTFLQEFSQTTLGQHSKPTETFVGVVRDPVYTPDAPDLETELDTTPYEGADPPQYAIVIPTRKHADWWVQPYEERLEQMKAHIEPTVEYLDRVRRQLYHSSGLDDLDFITYFETDDLIAFTDLFRELESIPEYRSVHYGDPTLLGQIHDPGETFEMLAEWLD